MYIIYIAANFSSSMNDNIAALSVPEKLKELCETLKVNFASILFICYWLMFYY